MPSGSTQAAGYDRGVPRSSFYMRQQFTRYMFDPLYTVGCAHSNLGGSGGMLPQKKFVILDPQRVILTHFGGIFKNTNSDRSSLNFSYFIHKYTNNNVQATLTRMIQGRRNRSGRPGNCRTNV